MLNRIQQEIFDLFGVSIMIFVLSRVVPGDPGRLALGPRATQEAVDELNHQLYMDRPLPVQYACWIHDILRTTLVFHRDKMICQPGCGAVPAGNAVVGSGGWCFYGVRCVAVGNAGGAIQGLICRRPSPRHVLYGDRTAIIRCLDSVYAVARSCMASDSSAWAAVGRSNAACRHHGPVYSGWTFDQQTSRCMECVSASDSSGADLAERVGYQTTYVEWPAGEATKKDEFNAYLIGLPYFMPDISVYVNGK